MPLSKSEAERLGLEIGGLVAAVNTALDALCANDLETCRRKLESARGWGKQVVRTLKSIGVRKGRSPRQPVLSEIFFPEGV